MNVVVPVPTDGNVGGVSGWLEVYFVIGIVIAVVTFIVMCIWTSESYLDTRERDEARRQAGADFARTRRDDWTDRAFFTVIIPAALWLFWGPALVAGFIFLVTRTIRLNRRVIEERDAVEAELRRRGLL